MGSVMIDFPFGWEQHSGPIFGWYALLPCKTFSTVQYRKDHNAALSREYALCKMDDGSVGKFERMGDPDARLDALV
jgi:hypothetical protein